MIRSKTWPLVVRAIELRDGVRGVLLSSCIIVVVPVAARLLSAGAGVLLVNEQMRQRQE